MNKDLIAIFEYLEREKGINRDVIIKAIEESLIVAARKGMKGVGTVSVEIDPKSGNIQVFAEKEVMEAVSIPEEEIEYNAALEINPDCEIGDWINVPVTPENFGRIAAQTARQVIAQKLRGAERDVIYEEYRHRIHELVSGTVKRIGRGATVVVDLGKVEAIMPGRFYPKTEIYHVGDRVQALLWEVRDTDNGGAEVVLTRSHPEMVKELFIQEVPELNDETVTVDKIVREAGYRTKLMVSSSDPKVDPLGACVGVRGTRVKNVIRELNNEKIDIVHSTDDPIALLQSLLHPIEIRKVSLDEEDNLISIVIEDEDYPAVIGKRGMNARLNSAMVGFAIEVKKMSEYQEEFSETQEKIAEDSSADLDEPLELSDINPFVLDSIKDAGFDTLRKLLGASPKEVADKAGISQELAEDIMEKIRKR